MAYLIRAHHIETQTIEGWKSARVSLGPRHFGVKGWQTLLQSSMTVVWNIDPRCTHYPRETLDIHAYSTIWTHSPLTIWYRQPCLRILVDLVTNYHAHDLQQGCFKSQAIINSLHLNSIIQSHHEFEPSIDLAQCLGGKLVTQYPGGRCVPNRSPLL